MKNLQKVYELAKDVLSESLGIRGYVKGKAGRIQIDNQSARYRAIFSFKMPSEDRAIANKIHKRIAGKLSGVKLGYNPDYIIRNPDTGQEANTGLSVIIIEVENSTNGQEDILINALTSLTTILKHELL